MQGMARKLRIQYEGALYHVINRGNYRRDVFESVGAAQAFEEALIETCEVSGWRLHGHVVMRNHYHLAVETPRANLVEGMHWLQSTFATRFNRLRQERGHLFQGRYQALLIEDSAALANVVDYIHLNPVRAGIVTPELLGGFRWSSLRRFMRPERPAWMSCGDWLAQRGLEDSPSGWSSYVGYLTELAGNEAEQKRRGLEGLSTGWAIGTQGWKRAIAKDHAQRALSPGVEAGELRELKSAHWTQVLNAELLRMGKTREDAAGDNCGAGWKIEVAGRLRLAGAPYAWITAELNMGKVSSVRSYLSQVKTRI
jgi:putative transposase